MSTINNYFNIPFEEKVLSTKIDSDIKKFIDPLKIDRAYTSLSKEMSLVIEDFFKVFIDEPMKVLGNVNYNSSIFKEPSENHLGYCRDGYYGNGGGTSLVNQLWKILPSLRSGNVQHFRHISFLCHRISDDVTSDLTTRIIFKQLAMYTLEICIKYGIKTSMSSPKYFWDHTNHCWSAESFELPLLPNGDTMIFIPENLCSSQVSMNHFRRFAKMGIVKYFMIHWDEVSNELNCDFSIFGNDGKMMTEKRFIEILKEHNFNVYDVQKFLSLEKGVRDKIIEFYEKIQR